MKPEFNNLFVTANNPRSPVPSRTGSSGVMRHAILRREHPIVLKIVISGLVLSGFAFAFQNGPPANPGQGGFTSSGAPANTAGPQGAFTSSGAPANTAGRQPDVRPTAPATDLDYTLADEATKLSGIEAAARSGNVAALRGYLQDPDAGVQGAAFEALSAKDERSAVQDLLKIIRDTQQPGRSQALQLLNNSPHVDDQTARAALREARGDRDPVLRQYALEALAVRDAVVHTPAGSQGPFASSGAPPGTAAQGGFFALGAPANTAGRQPEVALAPLAIDVDFTLEDQATKLSAIEAASRTGNPGKLRQYLQDPDAEVLIAAFEALSAKEERSAVQDLLKIIRDTKQPGRGQALQLLNNSPHVDEQIARAALREAKTDPDPLIRQYAIEALAVRDAAER